MNKIKQTTARRRHPHGDATLRADLTRQGYSSARGRDVLAALGNDLSWSLAELLGECQALPPDPNCRDGCRTRRYGRKTALPWASILIDRPVDTYHQSADHNPEDGDVVRRFAELTPSLRHNELLRRLIQFDLDQLPLTEAQRSNPIDVGIHLIRMVATPSRPGVSSPNCLHKDGEPWTFVHVMDRYGVGGGESVVADNNKTIIFEVTLGGEALDTIVVDDSAVYHMVRPIRVLTGLDYGFRTALLVDFTPLKPDIVPPTPPVV
jgi:hypothetical protein